MLKGVFDGLMEFDPKDPLKNTKDTGSWHSYDRIDRRIPQNRNYKFGKKHGEFFSEKTYKFGVKIGIVAGVFIEVVELSPAGEVKLGGEILLKSVDDLIKVAGKFSKGKTHVAENTIIGSIDDVFETITKDAISSSPRGVKFLKDGQTLHMHKSASTGEQTISIDEAGKRIKKIRFKENY